MMRFTLCVATGVLLGGAFLLPEPSPAAEPDAKGLEFFEKKIRPVLVAKCYKCHASDSQEVKGALLVDSRDALLSGGDSGPAVVPGRPADSLLMEALRYESFEMPPEGKLPDETIADFEKWIAMGAPDPRDGAMPTIQQEIDFEKARQFWSFQPVRRPAPPEVKDAAWPRDDVDRFLAARREAEGLAVAPDADPRVLVRRLHFDLVGLPPGPDVVERFAADPTPGAYAELVDRLLDSPQYGERWGRHWLDVARFAESNGRERNYLYPHAWRYRNYVIDAFNADKPFDRFIAEQLAGDLLPADSAAQRNEQLVATGFLAIGGKLLNERNREIFRMDMVDEQLDVTTRSFMALTVACARCHDHKFDPIPTEQYYAMAGILRSTNTLYGTSGQGNRQGSKLIALSDTDSESNANDGEAETKRNPRRVAQLRKVLQTAQRQIKQLSGGNKKNKGKKNAGGDKRQLAALRKRVREINAELGKTGKAAPSGPLAMGVEEGTVEDCPVYIRGETDDPGPISPRGFLTVATLGDAPQIPDDESGRRQLAQWIADPSNPLTSRVIVNRVWQQLFGRGLVATVDNFGANGEQPSHPELLDYLAAEFVSDGWSIKRLVRRLVMTRAYGMSSDYHAANYEVDPDNRLLWRMSPRRLDAEAIRDAMLAVSGELDLSRPDGSPVEKYGDTKQYGRGVNFDDEQAASVCRSVYLPIARNGVPESLRVFDFAEPSIIVGTREVTTVPAQALYMMNSPLVLAQSEQLARRLLDEQLADDEARIDLAYELTLARGATDEERQRATAFLERISASLANDKSQAEQNRRAAWAGFCQVLLASAEFRYLD